MQPSSRFDSSSLLLPLGVSSLILPPTEEGWGGGRRSTRAVKGEEHVFTVTEENVMPRGHRENLGAQRFLVGRGFLKSQDDGTDHAMVEREVEIQKLLREPERRRTGGGALGFRSEIDRGRGGELSFSSRGLRERERERTRRIRRWRWRW